MPVPGPPLGARPLSLTRPQGAGVVEQLGGDSGALSARGEVRYSRTRHYAVREEWRHGQTPRAASTANYPRFVGTRKVNPLSNNSERMRTVLQPDPWSASPRSTQVQCKTEGVGTLFATHTSVGHSATLVWPGAMRDLPREGAGRDGDDGTAQAVPRGLTKRDILCGAAREWGKKLPRPEETPRSRFGRGQLRSGELEEELVPRPPECRGKYVG